MSDMAEDFKAMREHRQDQHRKWFEENMKVLEGIPFKSTNFGHTLLFRPPTYTTIADFYPSTGRWRSQGKTYSGGGKAFLNWLREKETGK